MRPDIDAWLARCPDPATDPFPGMAEAGLFEPLDSYMAIARVKAALIERTGLMGVGGAWGGRQIVGRYFIDGFGTVAQKAAWHGKAAAVAISEPKVGAHPKLLTTRAEPDGDFVRITGEKAWTSNGPSADVIIVFAIVAETEGRKRYGAFLVPRDAPGVTLKDMPGFHALRPSRHCGVVLDNVRVPRTALLGGNPDLDAYPRMALPFRDQEDAVGTFSLLGAFRFLLPRLTAGRALEEAEALSLGAIAALVEVFAAGAEAVVAALDAGRLENGSPTLVGLRVLAVDILAHVQAFPRDGIGDGAEAAVTAMLSDIEAVLGVARGPRLARQARLGMKLAGR